LAISIPEVIAVPPSELNAVPIVDSINGNQPDGIAILSFPKIISGCIYDAAQPRWEWRQ
jgi:hypothetical protein